MHLALLRVFIFGQNLMNEVFKLGVILSAQDLASSKLGAITDKWEDLKKSFQNSTAIEQTMKKMEDGIYGIQKGFVSLGVGMSILKKLPIDEARSFEKELGLLKATSGATAEEMDKLKEAAIQAGMKTQFSPDQAAAGLTALASAGMNATKSIKALDATLSLASASAGKLSIDQAASDIAATVNTFRRSANEVADTFTTMANISSFSIQDLGSAWRGVNAISSSMNQSMEETALMLSAVKRAGFTTAESGEKVRMALEALSAPSKKAQDEMNKLGVSAYDSTGKFKSVIKIMDELKNAFDKKNMSEEARNKALSKILLSGGSQAYRALMALSEEERKDWISKLKDKEGNAKRFAKTQQETYEGISVTLQGVLSTFKVVFGDALLPILKTLKSALISVLSPMVAFFKENPGITNNLVKLVALTGALTMLYGVYSTLVGVKNIFIAATTLAANANFMEAASGSGLSKVLNFLTLGIFRKTAATETSTAATMRATIATRLSALWGRIDLVAKNAGTLAAIRYAVAQSALAIKSGILALATKAATAAQWLLNAAMTANPIGLVIVAIGALITIVIAAIRYYDKWTAALRKVWNEHKLIIAGIATVFLPILPAIAAVGFAIYGIVESYRSLTPEVERYHKTQMKAIESEKTALEKKLEKLQKQKQLLQNLGMVGTKSYNKVQTKIEQTKRKIEDMNDALAQSNGMLASLIKARSEMESKLETKKMLLDVAIASGDKQAIQKVQAEYDRLKQTIANTNVEIQKQKDLPRDLQAIVGELNKLQEAKKSIDTTMPELKGSKKYKEIEEQIKKGEESLKIMEIKISQAAQVSGKKFVETFAKGMGDEFPALYKKVSGGLGGLMQFLPQSDAKKGPLSKISHSGKSFLQTWMTGFESGKERLYTGLENTLTKVKGYLDFSSLAGSMTLDSPVSLESVLKSGEAIVLTLAKGVKNSANTLYEAIKAVFKKSWKLFTQSDAKEGPFSKMTYSGKALINTFAQGTESEKSKLHGTIEKTFGQTDEIIQKTGQGRNYIVERTQTSSNFQTTNNETKNAKTSMSFEYLIKEFNISGEDSGFGDMIEGLIYEELARKEAIV